MTCPPHTLSSLLLSPPPPQIEFSSERRRQRSYYFRLLVSGAVVVGILVHMARPSPILVAAAAGSCPSTPRDREESSGHLSSGGLP